MSIGVNKICVSNPEKTRSFVKCHNFFPSSHQRKILGELLFMVEIKLSGVNLSKSLTTAEEVFEIITNGLRTNYYVPETLRSDNLEEDFENALQKLNRLIHQEAMSSRNFENAIKNLNAVIGLSHEEKIYFTSVGSAQVFILKKNKIVDLISEEISPSVARTFSQIISGNLEKEDALIFSTPNFLDYFVFEKLSQIVNKLSGNEAAQKLTALLTNLSNKISVGALLLKKESKEEARKIAMQKEKEIKQLDKEKPAAKTEKIEKTISHPKIFKIKVEADEEETQHLKIKEEKTLPLPRENKKELEIPITKIIDQSSKKNLLSDLKLTKISLIKKIRLPKIIIPPFRLPRIKILPWIILAILIIFFGVNYIKNKNQEKNTLKFFLSLQEIQNNNALFNAALTYNDRKTANLLVEELKKQISSLEAETTIEKELLEQLKQGFEKNTDEIYGVERINEPEMIINLSALSKKDGLKKIVHLENGNFIIINQANNEIYLYRPKNKDISLITKADFYLNEVLKYDENNILLVGETQIKTFNLTNQKTELVKIETTRKNFNITDAELYDNKLYILDAKANQVFKYLKTDEGFGKEIPWLTENISLANAHSLTIDGSIYLLDTSGKILKFFLGKSQAITFVDPYPALIKPTKLLTSADLKYFYLLEPAQKRILIYDKNGNLQKQLVSEKFDDLRDIKVNATESSVFILNNTSIYEIKLK